MTEFKDKIKRFGSSIFDKIKSQNMRDVSRMAQSMLTLTGMVKEGSSVQVGLGIVSALDSTLESFGVERFSKIEEFVKAHKLVKDNSSLPRLLIDSCLDDVFEVTNEFAEDGWTLKKMVVGDGALYYGELEEIGGSKVATVSSMFYHTSNMNFSMLYDELWRKYPDGIHLSLKKGDSSFSEDSYIKLHKLETSDYSYVGDLSPKKLIEEIEGFLKLGESRSYMLAGEPGTGKTSFAYEVGRGFSSRVVKIDPSIATHLGGSDLDFILKVLNPGVLLFDDFDRASLSQETMDLLFVLENIKTRFKDTVIFATVNYFEQLDKAIVRPGRFDRVIWFDNPTVESKRKIAEKYLKKYNVPYDDTFLKMIIEETMDLSPVYIKELCIRMMHGGVECFGEVIDEFYRTVGDMPLSKEEMTMPTQEEIDNYIMLEKQLAAKKALLADSEGDK